MAWVRLKTAHMRHHIAAPVPSGILSGLGSPLAFSMAVAIFPRQVTAGRGTLRGCGGLREQAKLDQLRVVVVLPERLPRLLYRQRPLPLGTRRRVDDAPVLVAFDGAALTVDDVQVLLRAAVL